MLKHKQFCRCPGVPGLKKEIETFPFYQNDTIRLFLKSLFMVQLNLCHGPAKPMWLINSFFFFVSKRFGEKMISIHRILALEGPWKWSCPMMGKAWLPIQTTWGVFKNRVSQAPSRPKESDSQGIEFQDQKHWSKTSHFTDEEIMGQRSGESDTRITSLGTIHFIYSNINFFL